MSKNKKSIKKKVIASNSTQTSIDSRTNISDIEEKIKEKLRSQEQYRYLNLIPGCGVVSTGLLIGNMRSLIGRITS